jgi:hypothetical protein
VADILTVDLLAAILAHVPEGFIEWSRVKQQFQLEGQTVQEFCAEAATQGINFEQGAFYDAQRLTRAEFRSRRGWCRPQLPIFQKKGRHIPAGPSIQERQVQRAKQHAALTDPHDILIMQRLEAATDGYLWHEALEDIPDLWRVLNRLQQVETAFHR